ncbi:restriction endonuclease subunit S [Poseidonibacter lekithochrous]|uniref:restriction endonuclease subunit S n=1 Tax=Poseidonibacter lekithochrous TaxID=1904463 RepID=UPI0008FC2619|nr:restriction endonuclease subunit S [Poseidonibacter lekithochrous]QKJ24527.1 type I restriction/modification system, specificity subunit [Poseidonibacter lekithochrous]
MERVPAIRFSEFSEEWEENKIGNITDCIVPGRNKPKLFSGTIPWITTPDIIGKYIYISKINLNISIEESKSIGSKIVPTNSIIMSCVGELGLLAITKNELIINQQLHAFLPNRNINVEFLFYSLLTQKKYMVKVATKTTLLYMNKNSCNSIPIKFPSKQEQEKIASFLSAVDKKIEKLEEKIALQEKYKKAMMQKLFLQEIRFKADDSSDFPAWEEKKLGDLTKINQGLQIAISERYTEKVKDSYFYITNEFLRKGSSKKYFIKEPSASVICNEDDVLMTRTGNTGQVVTNVNGAFHNNFFRINYFKNFDKDFLVYFLRMRNTQNMILRYAGISTIPDLNHGDFYRLKIDLPSLKEQQKIANFLSSLDKKIEATKKQKQKAQEFKKGLLQQMFV